MSQDESPAVVEFGPASGPPDTPAVRRPALTRLLAGARLDDRTVPALAGLGAVAVFASLVSSWQVITVVGVSEFGSESESLQEVTIGVTDLGTWGAGYLMSVSALAACVALVLFGSPAVRQHLRLAGLGVTGALVAMVVALGVELSRNSLVYPIQWVGRQPDPSIRSGWFLALVGAAAVGASLYLAGRLPPPAGAEEGADGRAETGSLWRWRRNGKVEGDPAEPPPPADLTVMPARPFVHRPEQ